MMKNKPMTAEDFVAQVTDLIVENFGSLEAFVEAFPQVFEIVDQNGQPLENA